MNELKAIHKTVIVCFFLGTIAGLQAMGRNTESFVTVGLLVLAGVGFAIGKLEAVQKQTESVQKQTNGSQENLVRVIEEQGKRSDARMAEFAHLIASLPALPINTPMPPSETDEKPITEGDEYIDGSASREKPMAQSR